MPLRDSASAVDSPPMPPPTTITGALLALAFITTAPGLSVLAPTLEHDAETWEACGGRMPYANANCVVCSGRLAWSVRASRRAELSEPDHHHRIARASRRRHR